MPNTLVHIGIQVIAQRAFGIGKKDIGLVLCGCVIPDLPWILRRAISALQLADPLDLYAYSSNQSSLLFSLILAAALSLLLRNKIRTFIVIGISCAFHLLLDALQIKWGNGVILLAPFNWATMNWGLVWPENPIVYIATILGAVVMLHALSTSTGFANRIEATRIQQVLAGTITILWLILPMTFVSIAIKHNNHYPNIDIEHQARSEKYLELDRSTVQVRDKKYFAEMLSGEQIELLDSGISGPGVYSIAGRFESPQRLSVIAWHRHSLFRDVASLTGLSAILLWFVVSAVRQRKNK